MPKNTTVSYLKKRAPSLRATLAKWFEENKRDLPWRRLASVYPTVVSEFMLQQTQVKTVLPYYDRWLKRFPDFQTLAKAGEATVLKHWEGLGYYSRARNLHKLAKEITLLDSIPEDPQDWQQFKGIGAYTAAAITSISFKHPIACVDGNVSRIICRLTADETVYKDNTQAMKAFTPMAEVLLDKQNPGRHNEAMMELGATVCTKANPQCGICPLASGCKAKGKQPEKLPRKVARTVKLETIDRAWVEKDGMILLHLTNDNSRRLSGILELPRLAQLGFSPTCQKNLGKTPIITRKRGISHSQITEPIWNLSAQPIGEQPDLQWLDLNKLEEATLSGPHKRWIQEILLKSEK